MSLLQSLLLGVLQGISEFIPISSSGHLVVARAVLGIGEIPLLYDVLLHVATLIVVVVYFWTRIERILVAVGRWVLRRNTRDDVHHTRMAALIIIATVITAILGLVIRQLDLHLYPRIAAVAFLVTAAMLILSRFARGTLDYEQLRSRHGVIVGAVQGIAVIPGISRSGSTIFAALASGVSRERAGEFSFLIAIPAILGATVLELRHFGELGAAMDLSTLAAGFIGALVFGFLALSLLVRLVRGGQLWVFAIYLIPLGIWGLFAL